MTKDERHAFLAENTVSLNELGGIEQWLCDTSPHLLAADVKQRSFSRFLDTLGAPGPIAFDPFKGELMMRNTTFHAEFLGSMGRSDWLWAHHNMFLNLPESRTEIVRKLCHQWSSPFAEAVCIDFGETQRLLIQHKVAATALSMGLGDAYYVANDSQVYIVKSGQIPQTEVMSDFLFATNALLTSGVSRADIELAAETLGLLVAATAPLEIEIEGSLKIWFYEDHRVSKIQGVV